MIIALKNLKLYILIELSWIELNWIELNWIVFSYNIYWWIQRKS